MAEPAPRRWTIEEFFAWQENQTERYELVDGQPLRMKAGAKNGHDDIVVNLVADLRDQVRGRGCRPFTGDGSLETRPGQIRRPDVGVDCGPRRPDDMKAALPRLVVEVLSPSTRDFDTFKKLDEYKAVESLDYILVIEPNEAHAVLWFRDDQRAWRDRSIRGLDAEIDMPELGVTLRMASVYEGVAFPSVPRLIAGDEVSEDPGFKR